MSSAVQGLLPAPLWEHFERISAIPRPSKKEEKIAAHIVAVAQDSGLKVRRDATGNIVVAKPASAGKESSPSIALQSHIDMVCEKNKDVQHDFDRDGIRLVRSDGYIKASGTTLGADNGIGVAAAMSIMVDTSLVHGPLELLFTVDEETGLTGANGLQPDFLRSRILLNLDSEEDGALYVGCSGGRDTLITLVPQWEPVPSGFVPVGLSVGGLKGGHSGLDINTGRANAIKLLARALWHMSREGEVRLAYFEGGSKRNAIPREAEAHVHVKKEHVALLRAKVQEWNTTFRSEYATTEPGLCLEITQVPGNGDSVLKRQQQDQLLDALQVLPHGVVTMSADIPGLVETSTNVATISSTPGIIAIGTSQRSSVKSALDDIVVRVQVIGRLIGATAGTTDGYPGWKPDMHSHVLEVTRRSHAQLFGSEPAIKAIHAGLECGIIGERFRGMDMVSFGPTIEGAHSPDERVEIATVQKFWDLLTAVLRNLT